MRLEDAEDMTWREFMLAKHGYIRNQTEDWKKARLTAYYSLVATGAIDSKKTSIESFMSLEGKKKVNRAGLEALKKAQQKYLEQKNGRFNG